MSNSIANYRGTRFDSEEDSISARGRPRCNAYSRTAGRRCSNSAVEGERNCKYHCGKKALRNTLKEASVKYQAHLGRRLSDLVNEGLACPHGEIVSLVDELHLMRGMLLQTLDHLKGCEDRIEAESLTEDKQLELESLQAQARTAVMCQVEMIANMVERLVRIETRQSQAVSVNTIGTVVLQIVNAVTEEVKDEAVLTNILERLYRLRVPVGVGAAAIVKIGENGQTSEMSSLTD